MLDIIVRIIADGVVIPVALIGAWALLYYVPNDQKYRSYARVIMAGLTAYLIAKLVGTIYQPESLRPFEKLGVDAGASYLNNPGFPSDHVLFVTAITLAVWFETRQRTVTLVLLFLSLLVAIGRVSALVHTPLDVLGGIVIACIGALWYQQGDTPKKPVAKSKKS